MVNETDTTGGGGDPTTTEDGEGSGVTWAAIKRVMPDDIKRTLTVLATISLAPLLSLIHRADSLLRLSNYTDFLVSFAQSPVETIRGPVTTIIESWIVENIFRPIIDSVIFAFDSLFQAILWAAFGADRTPVTYVGPFEGAKAAGDLGLLDVPFWVADLFIGTGAMIGSPIIDFIWDINFAMMEIAAQAGIAGPIVLPILIAVELAAAGYALMYVLRSIDIPLVDQGPTLDLITAPIRRLWRRIGS